MPGRPRVAERWLVLLLFGLAAALLVAGWRLTWFLTDDAFIAFRYVSNSHFGHGYVWNPPPFRPVEGYSSFLWVVLLDGIWRLLRTPPPAAANVVALACGLLSLAVGTRVASRLAWRPSLRRWRLVLLGLFLLGIVTQRTFVTWTSSGFETALFDLLVLCWIVRCLAPGKLHVLQLATVATLLHLTRPEGILFAIATLGVLAARGWAAKRLRTPRFLAACMPLLGIPVHLAWRHAFYGAWLPNTYHAKVVSAWPESGIRYALSYVLEYALWFPLVVVLVVGLRGMTRRVASVAIAPPSAEERAARGPGRAAVLFCLGALATHLGYYTFLVGGDHFEYRIYSHLVVPGFLGLLWLASRAPFASGTVALLLAVQVLLALPVPWTHWALSQERQTRAQTKRMRVAIAPAWPRPVRWYANAFDALQAWLIEHWVCVRHQEHKVNEEYLVSLFPSRQQGELLPQEGFPVHAFQAVGVASWTLPHVNILDLLGLNDYVIARTPAPHVGVRSMAHERRAPEGYVDCFAPNVFLKPGGGVRIVPRDVPLTAARIAACESTWAARRR